MLAVFGNSAGIIVYSIERSGAGISCTADYAEAIVCFIFQRSRCTPCALTGFAYTVFVLIAFTHVLIFCIQISKANHTIPFVC